MQVFPFGWRGDWRPAVQGWSRKATRAQESGAGFGGGRMEAGWIGSRLCEGGDSAGDPIAALWNSSLQLSSIKDWRDHHRVICWWASTALMEQAEKKFGQKKNPKESYGFYGEF